MYSNKFKYVYKNNKNKIYLNLSSCTLCTRGAYIVEKHMKQNLNVFIIHLVL